MSQKILLITPPFTQLNTPYPATAYLKGFLNKQNINSFQIDLGIETILEIFSFDGLKSVFDNIDSSGLILSDNSQRIFNLRESYKQTIDNVISFLQGKNIELASLICTRNFLPEASRFSQIDDLEAAFGNMGIADKAKHIATLYLEDLADIIVEAIDPHFGFSRYAEKLGRSAATFDEIETELKAANSFTDNFMLKILRIKIETYKPTVVGFSVPFPGNLYSAFKCAMWLKKEFPEIKTIMGGGFANTELRSLTDIRVFEYFDFITIDDGEAPVLYLLQYFDKTRKLSELKRTFYLENGRVQYCSGNLQKDFSQSEKGSPDYTDLLLDRYISVIEIVNPMHRLWSDGRWNKLTLAHGCYWGRCTFCDTSLDYIGRFEPSTVAEICDNIEELIAQTGQHGFHFVDEAAPPALMKSLAIEIIKRKLTIVWWTNIRFEKSFTADLCQLLKESGCIAVSGGLEVASDRLLGLINKGVSVAKVAQVTSNFTNAGIMVHAYLMYGFPTQTMQETIDSLEVVRQLFEAGIVQSGFWHQFALTAHSPVGLNPAKYNIRIDNESPGTFANNDLLYTEQNGINHEKFSDGLKKSLYNYMHNICFDFPLQYWFDFKVPKTKIQQNLINVSIQESDFETASPNSKVIWLGANFSSKYYTKKKKSNVFRMCEITVYLKKENLVLNLKHEEAEWLEETLQAIHISDGNPRSFGDLQNSFEENTNSDFILFWNSSQIKILRKNGLLAL